MEMKEKEGMEKEKLKKIQNEIIPKEMDIFDHKETTEKEFHERKVENFLEESPRIQQVLRIQEQARKDREAEEFLLQKILTEQKMTEELNTSLEDNLQRTKEIRRYRDELEEGVRMRIYSMHGISEDKLEGIREYKNAYYKGCAFSLFLLSIVLTVLCGVLHTLQSDICIFMGFFTAIEGALLVSENKRGRLLGMICRCCYLLLFPAMMSLFVCYELHFPEYEKLLFLFMIAGMIILSIGVSSYFLYDPYLEDKRKIKKSKNRIREIQKEAQKEVKRTIKSRENQEKREQKAELLQEKKEQKTKIRQEKKEQKTVLKKEQKEARKNKRQGIWQHFKENKIWFWKRKRNSKMAEHSGSDGFEKEHSEIDGLQSKPTVLETETALTTETINGKETG